MNSFQKKKTIIIDYILSLQGENLPNEVKDWLNTQKKDKSDESEEKPEEPEEIFEEDRQKLIQVFAEFTTKFQDFYNQFYYLFSDLGIEIGIINKIINNIDIDNINFLENIDDEDELKDKLKDKLIEILKSFYQIFKDLKGYGLNYSFQEINLENATLDKLIQFLPALSGDLEIPMQEFEGILLEKLKEDFRGINNSLNDISREAPGIFQIVEKKFPEMYSFFSSLEDTMNYSDFKEVISQNKAFLYKFVDYITKNLLNNSNIPDEIVPYIGQLEKIDWDKIRMYLDNIDEVIKEKLPGQ